jgi:hypothetical protein
LGPEVLISLRHLVDRARHPRTRADELATLRARHRASPSPRRADDERLALAQRLRRLRRRMAEALGQVDACRGCAAGHPPPEGRWSGGHCCGGQTLSIFSREEVAALKLGGTKPRDWTPPDGDHAGCAFRGPAGCSLAPEDRPSVCLRYICLDLRAELKAREDGRDVLALAAAIRDAQTRFEALGDQSSSSPPLILHSTAANESTSACVATKPSVVPAPAGKS